MSREEEKNENYFIHKVLVSQLNQNDVLRVKFKDECHKMLRITFNDERGINEYKYPLTRMRISLSEKNLYYFGPLNGNWMYGPNEMFLDAKKRTNHIISTFDKFLTSLKMKI